MKSIPEKGYNYSPLRLFYFVSVCFFVFAFYPRRIASIPRTSVEKLPCPGFVDYKKLKRGDIFFFFFVLCDIETDHCFKDGLILEK